MIGIVVVSHSSKVSEGICDMVEKISTGPDNSLPIVAAGGNSKGELGTDVKRIFVAINKVHDGDGVVVLCDLGSGVVNSQKAIEMLDDALRNTVRIADAPILEGAVGAAVEIASEKSCTLDDVVNAAESSRSLHKK